METRATSAVIGDRYSIRGLLGEGGMARVYDGFDERLQLAVAVKILRPQTLALPGMRKRFEQEARIAARLVHPHIVAVLDYGEDRWSYLVMERLPGITLRDEILRGPLPKQRVVLVLTETLAALAAAHKLGVVHRDIKPSNILLDDGHTKIADFGIAKSFGVGCDPGRVADEMTMTGVVLGTPGYLAPERRSGQPATVQSDLYAVGAVMVEALTGRRLDSGPDATEHLPRPFRDVARTALAADPGDRFTSATDMLQGLGTRRTGRAVLSLPPTAPMTSAVPVAAIPLARGVTKVLTPPPAVLPRRVHTWGRRVQVLAAAFVVVALAIALYLVVGANSQTRGQAARTSSHHRAVSHHTTATRPQVSDPQGTAIRALASSLADAGASGDASMAAALSAVADLQPGGDRQTATLQVLALAQLLRIDGGITPAQYQEVVNALEPAGPTAPATAPSAPAPLSPGPPFHAHGHGDVGGQGDQG